MAAVGQARWHVVTGTATPIEGAAALAQRRVATLKRGHRRAVYRVDGPQAGLIVKHFEPPPWWRRLLLAWRGSAARREAETARRLLAAGVRTPAPLAWFEVDRGSQAGASGLVSEELPEAIPLDRLACSAGLAPRAQARRRRAVVEGLLRLVVAAHRSGFEHGDLHAGNVLVRPSQLDDPARQDVELHLIDFADSRWGAPFAAAAARDSLARLAASFRRQVSPALLRRFARRYLAQRPEVEVSETDRWVEELAREAWRRSAHIARRRDRRAWTSNRDYRQVRSADGLASTAAEIDAEIVAELLRRPERLVARSVHAPLKLGASSLVLKAEIPDADREGGSRPAVCKRIRARRLWQAPWGWWARRRARRAWQVAVALEQRGLPAARPLALLLPRGRDAYLLTDYVPGAVNLHLYGWELARRSPTDRRRAALRTAAALGRLVGSLHAWGLAHRDLKGCNLMVVESGERVETPLVDLDGIEVRRRLPRAERIGNLARLSASLDLHAWVGRSLRARFLQAYAREIGADRREQGRLWREVAHAARRLTSRRKRRNAAVG